MGVVAVVSGGTAEMLEKREIMRNISPFKWIYLFLLILRLPLPLMELPHNTRMRGITINLYVE